MVQKGKSERAWPFWASLSEGGGNVKTFRWEQRLQKQNLFMAY